MNNSASLEYLAKLVYQEFYKANKHAFCLDSWEQLTEGQREHYRKVSNKAIWEGIAIGDSGKPYIQYPKSTFIKVNSAEDINKRLKVLDYLENSPYIW